MQDLFLSGAEDTSAEASHDDLSGELFIDKCFCVPGQMRAALGFETGQMQEAIWCLSFKYLSVHQGLWNSQDRPVAKINGQGTTVASFDQYLGVNSFTVFDASLF